MHSNPVLTGPEKATSVRRMFGRIAGRYDLMNALMTGGRDQAWRRRMARLARLPPGSLALDLGTGTGDVALALLEREPTAWVVGADFALPMMAVGQRKARARGLTCLTFAAADALQLPFAAGTFDAVLHAFLIRNVADVPRAFAEQARVLKPGRPVVCLEATLSPSAFSRLLFRFGFGTLAPLVGGLVAEDRAAYTYLPQSVLQFPAAEHLAELMRAAGFRDVRYRQMMFGTVAILYGTKAE